MENLDLLVNLYITQDRQGPGSEAETLLAAQLANLPGDQTLKIADIGCGTGSSSLTLAEHVDCEITAVDFLPEFIDKLKQRAVEHQLSEHIEALVGDMADLPFEQNSLDVIWSEGAVYNIGFEQGIKNWKPLLKTGGKLAVSELTWLTDARPEEITRHWQAAYPQVATAGEKISQLEKHGYKVLGYFVLSDDSWTQNYYRPLATRFANFITEHQDRLDAAQAIIDEHLEEIALYEKYKAYVSYGFYVAEKV